MESHSLASISSLLTATLNDPESLEDLSVETLHQSLNNLRSQIMNTIQLNYTSFSKMSDTVRQVERENTTFFDEMKHWETKVHELLMHVTKRIQEKEDEFRHVESAFLLKQDVMKLIFVEQLLSSVSNSSFSQLSAHTIHAEQVNVNYQNTSGMISGGQQNNTNGDSQHNSVLQTPISEQTSSSASGLPLHFQKLFLNIQTLITTSLLIQQVESFMMELKHIEDFDIENIPESHLPVYQSYKLSKQRISDLKIQLRNLAWNNIENAITNCYEIGKKRLSIELLDDIPNQLPTIWIWNDIQIIQSSLDAIHLSNDQQWLYEKLLARENYIENALKPYYEKVFSSNISNSIVEEYENMLNAALYECYLIYLPLKICLFDSHRIRLLQNVIWPQLKMEVFSGRNASYFKKVSEIHVNFLTELENTFIFSKDELQEFREHIQDYERKWHIQLKLCFTITKQKVSKSFDQACEEGQNEIPPTILNRQKGELYLSVPKSLWKILLNICFHPDMFHLPLVQKYLELFNILLLKLEVWCHKWIEHTASKANIQLLFVFYQDLAQLEINIHNHLMQHLKTFLRDETLTLIESLIQSEATNKFTSIFNMIGDRCILDIVDQCKTNLKVIQTAYSVSMVSKPVKPVFGISQLFAPLQNMLNSVDIDENDSRVRKWTQEIINRVIIDYKNICVQSLETADTLYKNIQKLQKKQSESSELATQGIKQQIRLDLQSLKDNVRDWWNFSESDIEAFQSFDSILQ